jgi:hypothetical protein
MKENIYTNSVGNCILEQRESYFTREIVRL